MKIKLFFISIFVIFLIILTGCSEKSKVVFNNTEIEYIYYNAESLEKTADLIVVGKYNGKRENKKWRDEFGNYLDESSLTEFEVQKVLKGEVNKSEKIKIVEPSILKNNVYYMFNGYHLMTEKGEYLLFLTKEEYSEDIIYGILGIYQGKFDLNIKEKSSKLLLKKDIQEVEKREYSGENYRSFNELKKDVLEKYEIK